MWSLRAVREAQVTESVEAGLQIQCCGLKIKVPQKGLFCFLFCRACSIFRDKL